ncbi:MAG: hypothetical protein A2287_03900 [Candidatus Melainabacteria bacterium RIFOXYA12_FULL_32_12]|nr:MAG: hypothetical protein A2255_11170 [Candidatus Melainabacteria bacterium RIFOXYA2_FULL_32_9]OGI29375.1 MAG: hypothetical protein A2287_03900 [Candidatus Melainabacteria bacterium RIFOXYA12_FULL_32_12]
MRGAKVFFVGIAIPFLMAATPQAQVFQNSVYSSVTTNSLLEQALDCMKGTSGEWSQKAILGENLTKKPIKVEFKNLSQISPMYATFDALGWKDGDQLYIYINNKHNNAPPEALASLLCHEAVHQDPFSSIEEETYGWGYEAKAWLQMKERKPELNNLDPNECALVRRLNTLESMFKAANYTTSKIRESVSTNPGYKNLPLYSPGFGK